MNRLLAELCADHIRAELFELEAQRTDADGGRELIRLIVALHAVNLAGAAGDGFLDHRIRIGSAVVDNRNALTDQLARRIGKGLRALLGEDELHEILVLSRGLVLHLRRLCALHLIAGQNGVTARIYEGQRTRPTEILENLIGIGDARNVNVDAVPSLLIDLRLGGIRLHTPLELEDGILHVLRARILFLRLIRDADATCQIEAELNLVSAHTIECEIQEADQHCQEHQKAQRTLSLFALHTSYPP